MHVDFKHCIQSAKPFFSDKLKLFRVLFVVSVSKCRLSFTITVFGPLRGHVNTRKNFICIDGTPKLITSAERKKCALNDIIDACVYNENLTGLWERESYNTGTETSPKYRPSPHLSRGSHVSPSSVSLAVLFLGTLVMINHVVTLVSGMRYVLACIVDWLEGDKSVNRT